MSNQYNKLTYIINHKNKSIECLKCGDISSRPLNYDERYCDKCGFHNDMAMQKQMHDAEYMV